MEKRLIRMIEKFNRELAEYQRVSGDNELPYVDCTISGYSVVNQYVINGDEVIDGDGIHYDVNDCESVEYLYDAIKYDRRRLAKAWRIWKSENPDNELDRDEE